MTKTEDQSCPCIFMLRLLKKSNRMYFTILFENYGCFSFIFSQFFVIQTQCPQNHLPHLVLHVSCWNMCPNFWTNICVRSITLGQMGKKGSIGLVDKNLCILNCSGTSPEKDQISLFVLDFSFIRVEINAEYICENRCSVQRQRCFQETFPIVQLAMRAVSSTLPLCGCHINLTRFLNWFRSQSSPFNNALQSCRYPHIN